MTSKQPAFLLDVYETILSCDFKQHRRELPRLARIDEQAWNRHLTGLFPSVIDGRLSMAEAYAATVVACGALREPDLLEELVRKDVELLLTTTRVHADTVPFLRHVHSEGCPVAFVSNCGDDTRPLLTELGLVQRVDAVVLSCELGAAKPSPEIYQRALQELDVAAEEAVFVDDQARYCAGASALGIQALQINRNAPALPEAPTVIRSLYDLLELL